MAKDVQDTVRDALLRAVEVAGVSGDGKSRNGSSGGLGGMKGIAAGAGAAALVPLAVKGAGRLGVGRRVKGAAGDALSGIAHAPQHLLHDTTSKLTQGISGKINEKVDEAGGPGGILKNTLTNALPFGDDDDDEEEEDSGGGGGGKGGVPGVGKGRRMPVQQSVDIGVNIETVYNQFTQFEEWPNFMHRVTSVSQDDECTVSFATKIWTRKREFTAKIETQRPNERIKWKVSQGLTHTGVVTFHELGPNLTRVLLGMDVQPGGMIEKLARGMRNVKRAARADLHRFKAFIEMSEQETGAWRGVIVDGELVEEHDASYDDEREYANIEDLLGSDEENEDEEHNEAGEAEEQDAEQDEQPDEEGQEEEEEQPRSRRSRSRSQASNGSGESSSRSRSASSGSGRSRAAGSSGGQSRSTGSRSRNGQSGNSSRSRAGASGSSSGTRRQSRSRKSHSD